MITSVLHGRIAEFYTRMSSQVHNYSDAQIEIWYGDMYTKADALTLKCILKESNYPAKIMNIHTKAEEAE